MHSSLVKKMLCCLFVWILLLGFFNFSFTMVARESYGEDIVDTDTEECNNYSEEEDYEDSFINDGDPEVYPPSPVSNGGGMFHTSYFLLLLFPPIFFS